MHASSQHDSACKQHGGFQFGDHGDFDSRVKISAPNDAIGLNMIEVCSLKRIIFLTVFLIGACLMILTLESILSDHDSDRNGSNSSEGCWEREEYVVKQKCMPCTEFERASKHLPICIQSKYKELVTCRNSGDVYRRCDNEKEGQHFWIFEGSMLVTGLLSSLSVVLRQKHLDRKMIERIQQQVAAGV
ncbi:hypothetical protein HPB49_017744 [Dermacentor silvarum]|uniref:Uncharacterized protein n=1 Tax=Dermacentor silvarum TaxID=543639 RepID=A0ACB8DEU6_DERSI|nr:protein JTB [Dermacentor silvarum]KAH7966565.1 hypothetical protein HPB49_017744 [Dermacentor silvarum]